jgi:hypothetical protein
MLKKGFCEDILTKKAHFGQEKLTGSSQETLIKLCKQFFSPVLSLYT